MIKYFDNANRFVYSDSMSYDHVEEIIEYWKKEHPDLDTSSIVIIARICRLAMIIEKGMQPLFSKYHINQGEFDVLATLRRSGKPYSLTPSTLFQSLMLSSGGMTNRIDRLENAGLVERSPHPTDRRGIMVTLTAKGVELIEKVIEDHEVNMHTLVEYLTSREKEKLEELLGKLMMHLADFNGRIMALHPAQ